MEPQDSSSAQPQDSLARDVTEHIHWARPIGEARFAHADPMLLPENTRKSALADLVVFLLAIVVAVLLEALVLTGVAWSYGLSIEEEATRQALAVPAVVLRASLLCCAIYVIVRRRGQLRGSLGLTRAALGLNIFIGLCTTVVIYGFVYSGVVVIMWTAPDLAKQLQQNADNLRSMIPQMPLHEGFMLMIVVAFYEELVVRGFIMTRLRRWCGSWTLAVVLSTALFTLPHMLEQQPASMIFVAMLSLVCSVVTIWRRSLVPAITAHLLFNFSQFIGVFYGHLLS